MASRRGRLPTRIRSANTPFSVQPEAPEHTTHRLSSSSLSYDASYGCNFSFLGRYSPAITAKNGRY